jgi:hypothetical protein
MRRDVAGRTAGKAITLRRLAQPWTLVLIATGAFQFLRGAPVDGAFFAGIAALLLADALGWLPRATPRRPRGARHLAVWLLAAAVPLGIALVLAPRHGVVEGIIVAGIGASALLLGWDPPAWPAGADPGDSDRTATRRATTSHTATSPTTTSPAAAGQATASRATATPAEGAPDSMPPAIRRAAILWSVIAVICCLWEVAAFLLGLPSPEAEFEHPSISDLLDPVVGTIQGRIAFTALWLLLGVALLGDARSRASRSSGTRNPGAASRRSAGRGSAGRRAGSRAR